MRVVKRNGNLEDVSFDKITKRISKLCYNLDETVVSAPRLAQSVIAGIYDNVTTRELDNLAAETAASMSTVHPDYDTLAARICVSAMHKETSGTFSERVARLYAHDLKSPIVSHSFAEIVVKHAQQLDAAVCYDRDFNFDYFGICTLRRSYLLTIDRHTVETPQDMFMRVSVAIHGDNMQDVVETYEYLSRGMFIHATPTLFNAGTCIPQMSSCFLLRMKGDSIDGIFSTLRQCALISKSSGGIGFCVSDVRAQGARISTCNGQANGIVPMLKVFADTARYVDQGGGKRRGAFAAYIEPWHADILDFLNLRKPHGNEELRARNIFVGLWIPDLFMRRVEANMPWSLFCPNTAKDLVDRYGDAFDQEYERLERKGLARRTLPAQDVWRAILESQTETGTPYMLYKDVCNRRSNQKHLGTIHCSNLCTEIIQHSDVDNVAVCNLASLALPKFVCSDTGCFDHDALAKGVHILTKNLNLIIDRNFYPVPEAQHSNLNHRPIGLGVQGLADVFAIMGLSFDSAEALALNREIFETIYYAALDMSCRLAEIHGAHASFVGSPASQGILQMDMWAQDGHPYPPLSHHRHDWSSLRARIAQFGLRNSLLVAPMPTASTSQILGNTECFEPFTSNLYTRRVLSGEFVVLNKHLTKDLIRRGLWSQSLKDVIVAHEGSVQNIAQIPDKLKHIYKTVWEIKQRNVIDMAAARAPFIDQSQSMSLFMQHPTFEKLSSMHFYAWRSGLKTGMYYLRTRAASSAIKFTISPTVLHATSGDQPSSTTVADHDSEQHCQNCSA